MRKRVCVISHRNYPGDPRLSNQVLALQNDGWEIDFVGIRPPGKPSFSIEEGVRCHRLPSMQKTRGSKVRYVLEYASFIVTAMVFMVYLHVRRRYSLVFVTNLPDPLVFAAAFPKLMGARVLFDLREVTPEMLEDRFRYGRGSPLMRFAVWLEQGSLRFVDQALSTNNHMRQVVLDRGTPPEKVGIMLNLGAVPIWQAGPQLPDPTDDRPPFRLVMHGSILRRYGLEHLFDAIKVVAETVPELELELEIIGSGEIVPELEQRVRDLGLEHVITFPGFMSFTELIPRGGHALAHDPAGDGGELVVDVRDPSASIRFRTSLIRAFTAPGCRQSARDRLPPCLPWDAAVLFSVVWRRHTHCAPGNGCGMPHET